MHGEGSYHQERNDPSCGPNDDRHPEADKQSNCAENLETADDPKKPFRESVCFKLLRHGARISPSEGSALVEAKDPDVQKTERDDDLKNKRYNFHLRGILGLQDAGEMLGSVSHDLSMKHLLECAQAISAIGFLAYGIACFQMQRMRDEFVRYRLPHLRVLTGLLQIIAGIGLLLGYVYPVCALVSSLGLSLMMLVAIWVRVRIRDPFSGFLQALLCFFLNLFVFHGYWTGTAGRI